MHREPIWDVYGAHWIDHAPNKRFAIYSAGNTDIVLDHETGLVWERRPDPDWKQGWRGASITAFGKAIAGRKGWRVPTIEELLSLVDPAHSNPTLPAGHPFVGIKTDDFYWSSTLGDTSPPKYAWGYNFGNGDTSNVDKSVSMYLWLVRGGFGYDYLY